MTEGEAIEVMASALSNVEAGRSAKPMRDEDVSRALRSAILMLTRKTSERERERPTAELQRNQMLLALARNWVEDRSDDDGLSRALQTGEYLVQEGLAAPLESDSLSGVVQGIVRMDVRFSLAYAQLMRSHARYQEMQAFASRNEAEVLGDRGGRPTPEMIRAFTVLAQQAVEAARLALARFPESRGSLGRLGEVLVLGHIGHLADYLSQTRYSNLGRTHLNISDGLIAALRALVKANGLSVESADLRRVEFDLPGVVHRLVLRAGYGYASNAMSIVRSRLTGARAFSRTDLTPPEAMRLQGYGIELDDRDGSLPRAIFFAGAQDLGALQLGRSP